MLPEQKQLIKKNWTELMQISEIDSLAKSLVEKSIFTQKEILNIFSSENERHNKRIFLFTLEEKDESAFVFLIQWLFSMRYDTLAHALTMKKSGCIPFRLPKEQEDQIENELTSSIEAELLDIPTDDSQTPLTIKVQFANEFCDTTKHNPNLAFYHSRSKRRGRVLIINNYDFHETNHPYRTGATVDQENLEKLFSQMGGWVIEKHKNITAEEMRIAIKDFVKEKKHQKCDICFVIVMSHGSEKLNTTIVYGKDGKGKPKVFIYQVCRGGDIDVPRTYTEIDGLFNLPAETSSAIPKPVKGFFRPVDDMLIGFATMLGSKAHRDPYRGTWYIELICQNFMNLAKTESVDHLLYKVDEGLRKRMSEIHTVQTSETISKGFKKLYLNPGIYELNGKLKRKVPTTLFSQKNVDGNQRNNIPLLSSYSTQTNAMPISIRYKNVY